VSDIRQTSRKQCSSNDGIRIVLDGLPYEVLIADMCRCEGIVG